MTHWALPQNLSPVNPRLAEKVSRETEASTTQKRDSLCHRRGRKNGLKYDAKGKGHKENDQHQAHKNVNDLSRNTVKKIKEQRRESYMDERLQPLPRTLHI